jgi:phosphoribosylglycinamide formyltransferase-1
MTATLRIGALISGGGTNLEAILEACHTGAISGRVVFVGSDNPSARGLERARRRGIPTFVVDYGAIARTCRQQPLSPPADCDLDAVIARQRLRPADTDPASVRRFFTGRVLAERALLDAAASYPFDLLVLAGFMRNLTPYFIDRVNTPAGNWRIMNIHPALLPSFPGVDGYGDTFRYGCKVGGCSVHFIDYGEDSGPIIGQRAFAIEPTDTLESIRQRGLALEWQLYPECIQLFAENRLEVVAALWRTDDGREVRRTIVRIRPAAHAAA